MFEPPVFFPFQPAKVRLLKPYDCGGYDDVPDLEVGTEVTMMQTPDGWAHLLYDGLCFQDRAIEGVDFEIV